MAPVSITNMIFNKILYHCNADTRQNIFDYMNIHNIGNKGEHMKSIKQIFFKSQIGGKTYEIELNDNLKYEFYIDGIIPETNTHRRMCFMSNSYSYDCLCVLFGNKTSGDDAMRIESLLSSNECVKCENGNKKIKAGDIMIQILLKTLEINKKFEHIKKFELSDTSKKSCYDIGIELVYLKTITHGIPYYAKFGFRPKNENDCKIFRKNREIFKLNKKILNTEFIKIINKSKVNMNDGTYEIYKRYIKKYILENEEIYAKLFFMEIINLIDLSIGKKDIIKDNIFIRDKQIDDKDAMKGICDFVNSIYKNVYKYLGYGEYFTKIWILYLDR